MEHRKGDWVAWTRSIKESYFLRCGEIVEIIPAGVDLMDVIGDQIMNYRATGRVLVSSNDRYAIKVQTSSPSGTLLKPQLYTPASHKVDQCMNYNKLSRYAYARIPISEKIKRENLRYSDSR